MKVLTVVGARPQFVKTAPVSRALRQRHVEVLVHTGQHYDDNMSAVFFSELGIPPPDYNLAIGPGSHGSQTGAMLARVEEVLLAERPDAVIVYGDTNSTLAGALAAVKLGIPIAHVEAGLRSFNRAMPEEINRVVTDHLAAHLYCPSQVAVDNLAHEGICDGVLLVGDVMAEALAFAVARADSDSRLLETLGVRERRYVLLTLHRAENTDDVGRLETILRALNEAGEPVIFPVHPRTRRAIGEAGLGGLLAGSVHAVDPLGYFDMIRVAQAARVIATDSGGLQKEAYWLGVPCITLRGETEWSETVAAGWNVLTGADPALIADALGRPAPRGSRPPLYGDGGASRRIVEALERLEPK